MLESRNAVLLIVAFNCKFSRSLYVCLAPNPWEPLMPTDSQFETDVRVHASTLRPRISDNMCQRLNNVDTTNRLL